jgi:hypothetical protein
MLIFDLLIGLGVLVVVTVAFYSGYGIGYAAGLAKDKTKT